MKKVRIYGGYSPNPTSGSRRLLNGSSLSWASSNRPKSRKSLRGCLLGLMKIKGPGRCIFTWKCRKLIVEEFFNCSINGFLIGLRLDTTVYRVYEIEQLETDVACCKKNTTPSSSFFVEKSSRPIQNLRSSSVCDFVQHTGCMLS